MIKASKVNKEEYCQCTSCQRDGKETSIYKFEIGKTEQQTITLRLCFDCLCLFVGNAKLLCRVEDNQ